MTSYKHYFADRTFLISFFSGWALLGASLVVQFFADRYATRAVSQSVTDIVLSNIRAYDIDGIFVYGTLLLVGVALFVGFWRINYLPFATKSCALFTLIRAVFISLTHVGPFPTHISITVAIFRDTVFNGIFNGAGSFFSGHTGLPFLLALMVWDNKKLRFMFLGFSAFFAVVVLLAHLHYSIDVLSAFFITYSIFHISKFLFKKDWQIFHETL